MSISHRTLWPFDMKAGLIAAAGLLLALLAAFAVLRAIAGWPGERSENVVFLSIVGISLLPIVLALLDVIVDRGAVIEYGGIKVDFSQSRDMGAAGIKVASNIGVRGEAVTDSSTTQILDALRSATASDLVVIDLEDGQAWWETRLLVLLAGAVRLQRPEKMVFVGTDARKPQTYLGWARPADLLPLLLDAHPEYRKSRDSARAASRQWELLDPDSVPAGTIPLPPVVSGLLATNHAWMAFDQASGRRNELLEEQLLQNELGNKVETIDGPRKISLVRFQELFRPVIHQENLDLNWPSDRQLNAVLDAEAPHVAITQHGRYISLVSKLTLLSEVLRNMVKGRP